jgi:hypothetical protein
MKQFLVIALSIIGFSALACSEYQSARSQGAQTNSASPSAPATKTSPAATQEKAACDLTQAGAPDIKGLRLGMTPEQVLALLPGSDQDAEVRARLANPPSNFGVSSFVLRPEKYGSKETFAGISQITFTLLDGRVSSFSAGYNGPEWPHVDKFVTKISEGTSLPPVDQWEPYVGMDNQLKILKCVDFEIRVFAGGPGGNLNYVSMSDLLAAKKLKERRDKARASATPEPSPNF